MLKIERQVKALEGISTETVTEDVLYSTEPLVLKGFCQHWPLVQAGLKSNDAAADYLRSVYSGEPVIGSLGAPENNGRVFYNAQFDGFNVSNSKVNLNQVLDKLLAHADDPQPPTMYVGSTNAARWFPALIAENQFSLPTINPLISLWIGNQSKIAAHYDFPTNVACNVVGRRRFILFPPDQIENLYPGPIEFAPGGQEISLVDFDNPDYQRFPKFEKALTQAQVAELEPGDALILPSMWWHHVQGLDSLNVLITHWWRETPGFYGRPNNALSMAMLALRSLPPEQRKAWKHIFDYYIFNESLESHEFVPEHARGILTLPLDENMARKLRADLLNKLKR